MEPGVIEAVVAGNLQAALDQLPADLRDAAERELQQVLTQQ